METLQKCTCTITDPHSGLTFEKTGAVILHRAETDQLGTVPVTLDKKDGFADRSDYKRQYRYWREVQCLHRPSRICEANAPLQGSDLGL